MIKLESELLAMKESQNNMKKKLGQMVTMLESMNSLIHLKYFAMGVPVTEEALLTAKDGADKMLQKVNGSKKQEEKKMKNELPKNEGKNNDEELN